MRICLPTPAHSARAGRGGVIPYSILPKASLRLTGFLQARPLSRAIYTSGSIPWKTATSLSRITCPKSRAYNHRCESSRQRSSRRIQLFQMDEVMQKEFKSCHILTLKLLKLTPKHRYLSIVSPSYPLTNVFLPPATFEFHYSSHEAP